MKGETKSAPAKATAAQLPPPVSVHRGSAAPTPHGWTIILAVAAIILSLGSSLISWANFNQIRKINHTHVKPDIMFSVRHNTLPLWTNTPYTAELVILNRGPIKAASVYAGYRLWIVDTNLWWPYCNPSILEPLNKTYSFVIPELEVGDGRVKSLLAAGPVAIYEVELSFFRPNDMEKFSQKALFFYMDGQFYDQIGFQQKPFYRYLMKNLENRIAGRKGELPPGKTPPPEGESMPSFLFSLPDDNELPRALKPLDFH
jgi:hypothetical protein